MTAIGSLKSMEQFTHRQIAHDHHHKLHSASKKHRALSLATCSGSKPANLSPTTGARASYIYQASRKASPTTRTSSSQIRTTGIDNSRHKADSARKYGFCFKHIRPKMKQYRVETGHTYDLDEKGFMLGAVGHLRRVFRRASHLGQEEEEYYSEWLFRVDSAASMHLRRWISP